MWKNWYKNNNNDLITREVAITFKKKLNQEHNDITCMGQRPFIEEKKYRSFYEGSLKGSSKRPVAYGQRNWILLGHNKRCSMRLCSFIIKYIKFNKWSVFMD